jgi:hypothetical protein
VYAVEIPDREHWIGKCFRQIFYAPDDPHTRRIIAYWSEFVNNSRQHITADI